MTAWDLRQALDTRRQEHLYRQRPLVTSAQGPAVSMGDHQYLCFCSNDYLGLAAHPEVRRAFLQAAEQYGVGATASHLINGHMQPHQELEERLAKLTNRPRALLFSSGYMANLGVMSALLGKQDAVFADRLNHASLIDGVALSGAKSVRFGHQDLPHLASRLESVRARRKLIVTDGIFSMDGDAAQLPALAHLAAAHDAWLMVDDAHGIGVAGQTGAGTVEAQGLSDEQVPILMATLGKAMGTFGAFVAGSEQLIETLIQFSRTYIYTTALPPALAVATLASLEVLRQEPGRREHLNNLIRRFRHQASENQLPLLASESPIQAIIVGSAEDALQLNQFLLSEGILVTAIRPPTVPRGTARLRITLSAAHSNEQIDRLVASLIKAKQKLPGSFNYAGQ
ncbi:MAG TPA: 8-amino-7-oxononanoate synthase [Gammaproteobacteria bacterium]|nr:8-amino-7-oxononanoate synthase [Gammaproteobacteria bacterium]